MGSLFVLVSHRTDSTVDKKFIDIQCTPSEVGAAFSSACALQLNILYLQGKMSNPPVTPRTKGTYNPTTPATARVAATNAPGVHSSPHYATTRRHSLYGVEDRVVIDLGSRIWKVGFSGEGRPRDVFYGGGSSNAAPFWKLTRAKDSGERAEEEKLLEARLQTCLRSVFHE